MTLKVAIIGCGNRGADVYAKHLAELGAEVAYLVEPRPARLATVAARHAVPVERQFAHWEEFFALSRAVDAVVIATPDSQHVEPCLRALALDYDVLLEKPICLNEAEMDVLLTAEAKSQGRVAVCHVLRASPFFRAVHEVLESGRLGRVVGIDLNENVAYWHFAHSYVRGNWAQSPPAGPFLLAKSCHDLDVLRWFAGAAPLRVGSEGRLNHFRPENAPAGANERCVTCPLTDCPYDARVIYSKVADATGWPVTVLTAGGVSLAEALATGPYGRCVYAADNNVVDHQAVTVVFQSGLTAQLTSSAFTHNNTRTIKVFGTHGELRGHMDKGEIEVYDFRTGKVETLTTSTAGIHGGGDIALVTDWLRYLRREADVPTPLSESLDSHRMAFAAERARKTGTVEVLAVLTEA